MAGVLGTHAMASNHDEASPNEAKGNAQEASQALDDDALHEKYGITPGTLKREEPAMKSANGDEGQAQVGTVSKAAESDNAQQTEQGGWKGWRKMPVRSL